MYKQTLYRGFCKSKAIMESYQKSNDTRSKLTSICEIANKKITMVIKLGDQMPDLLEEPLEVLVKQQIEFEVKTQKNINSTRLLEYVNETSVKINKSVITSNPILTKKQYVE